MIRDLALAFFAGLGLGAITAVITGLACYRRAGPEFPPARRDP